MKKRTFDEWFWDFLMYNQDGYVPKSFVTLEGNKLGVWVSGVRLGEIKLSNEQRKRLNNAGFDWRKKLRSFDEWFEEFKEYNQDGYVPWNFETPNGNKLGQWVCKVRRGQVKLTDEQIEKLDKAGFLWKKIRKRRSFDEWLIDFIMYNQNGSVPGGFVTPEGNRLGDWVHNIRSGLIKLTAEQKQMLKDANFVWSLKKSKNHNYD